MINLYCIIGNKIKTYTSVSHLFHICQKHTKCKVQPVIVYLYNVNYVICHMCWFYQLRDSHGFFHESEESPGSFFITNHLP